MLALWTFTLLTALAGEASALNAAPEVAPKGKLVIDGGGKPSAAVYKKTLALAGGPKAKVVIIPQASDLATSGPKVASRWRDVGAEDITILDISDAKAAVEVVNRADLIWIGGGRVVSGAISVGALIAFLQYAQRFYQPLSDLSEKYNILQAAMASSERIFRLLDTTIDITTPEGAYSPETVKGDLQFDDVWFSYKEGEPVLKGVSFAVRPGETLAVVGHTGAGKSTLASLLLRFYDIGAGAVRVDGVDVRQWDLARLRRSVAMVLQDVFLFSGSVGANIRLGEESIDDERVRWAAGEVHALPFIERLPGGFDAVVKERGAGLSVGQKQLIAFARALAVEPSILILDEATASIDTETEQLIQQALDRLLVGRTSIVIAHRLSTIQKADRILVLHKGEVREYGTHQELLAMRGIYYRLYLLQYKDQELPMAAGA